jgi:hypothetical protein
MTHAHPFLTCFAVWIAFNAVFFLRRLYTAPGQYRVAGDDE